MKRILPPLLALPFLLDACSNMNSAGALHPKPPAPVRIADRSTFWGEQPSASSPSTSHTPAAASGSYAPKTGTLATTWGTLPTYRHQPRDLRQFKNQFSWLPVFFAGIDNTALADVLVNRDGTVRDVAIIKGSGYPAKDASVRQRLEGVHITTKIAPEDPAPYVFRTVVTFQKIPGELKMSDSNYYNDHPQTHYAEQPVSPANLW